MGFDVVAHTEFAEDAERENAASLFEPVVSSVNCVAADGMLPIVGLRELSPTYDWCSH
jgi:hypothetical protein